MLRQLGAQDTSLSDLVYTSRVTQATVGPLIKRGAKVLRVSYKSDSVVSMLNDVNVKQSH
jgi:hypothetical protein